MSETAQKIRAERLVTYTVGEGGEAKSFLLLTPQARHLSQAGIPIVCFSHRVAAIERLKSQMEYFAELARDEKKSDQFMKKLLGQCMVDPKFHDGPLATCPQDSTCLDLMEHVAGNLFEKLLHLAGYGEAEEAAKWAEGFREDAGREAGAAGGPTPEGPSVGAAQGQPG